MKNKRLMEFKKVNGSLFNNVIREGILSKEANDIIDTELSKCTYTSEEWNNKFIELFKKGKIKVSDLIGYVVDKKARNGKVLETFVISKTEANKFYEEKMVGGEVTLIKKLSKDIEEDISVNNVKDMIIPKVSFNHYLMNGNVERVYFSPRIIIRNDETDFVGEEDANAKLFLLKTMEKIFELYGNSVPQPTLDSFNTISIGSDFSRKYNMKKKHMIDTNQKLMILSMFK